jgi:hypothetical protein
MRFSGGSQLHTKQTLRLLALVLALALSWLLDQQERSAGCGALSVPAPPEVRCCAISPELDLLCGRSPEDPPAREPHVHGERGFEHERPARCE